MDCNKKVNPFQQEKENSSISNMTGNILEDQDKDTYKENVKNADQVTKNNFLNSCVGNSLNVTTDDNATEIIKPCTICGLDVPNDQKDTENCLERFRQKYDNLIKQKKPIKYTQCSTINEQTQTPSSTLHNKINESTNPNLSHPSNLPTLCPLNSNKPEKQIETNKSIHLHHGSKFDSSAHFKHNENAFCENSLNKKCINNNFKSKEPQQECNKYIIHDAEENKAVQCNENIDGFLNLDDKINIQRRKNENFQKEKQEVTLDHNKFYQMLDELNNEVIKIKDLFTNNKEIQQSFCHGENNQCNKNIPAGEDCIDDEMYWLSQQNTTFVDRNSVDQMCNSRCRFLLSVDSKQHNHPACYHNNKVQKTYNQQNFYTKCLMD